MNEIDAYLQLAKLQGVDLQNADLRGADLWGVDLRGADLRSAISLSPREENKMTPAEKSAMKYAANKWAEDVCLTDKSLQREEHFDSFIDGYQAAHAKQVAKVEMFKEIIKLYEQAFDDTGNDFSHLVCLTKAREALAKLEEKSK
jgi:hypothetical protein